MIAIAKLLTQRIWSTLWLAGIPHVKPMERDCIADKKTSIDDHDAEAWGPVWALFF
jgi:hypothetical protein